MKRFALLLFALLSVGSLFSQQDPMFSQYMYNQMVINPAYAGSRDALSGVLLFRRQWFGISGAPFTGTVSIHAPLKRDRHAFGGTIINDQISYLGQTWINAAYAYRIPIGKGKLSLGLQGTFFNYRVNWAKADLIDEADALPISYGRTLFLPNAGFGVFYYTKKWFAGASIPRLLINSLDPNRPGVRFAGKDNGIALLKRHMFFTGGYVFDLNDQFQIKPSMLIKFVNAAPIQFDVNLNFYYERKYGFGFSYRSMDGVVVMADFLMNDNFRVGYAYDFPFTRLGLGGFTSGSHEIVLWYDFRFKTSAVVSPVLF